MEFVNSHPTACAWAGRALSALVTLALFADAAQFLFLRSATKAEFAATGFADSAAAPLGIHYRYLRDPVRHPADRRSRRNSGDWLPRWGDLTHFRLGAIGSRRKSSPRPRPDDLGRALSPERSCAQPVAVRDVSDSEQGQGVFQKRGVICGASRRDDESGHQNADLAAKLSASTIIRSASLNATRRPFRTSCRLSGSALRRFAPGFPLHAASFDVKASRSMIRKVGPGCASARPRTSPIVSRLRSFRCAHQNPGRYAAYPDPDY